MNLQKSHKIAVVQNATVGPCDNFNIKERAFNGGVFDSENRVVELSYHQKGDYLNVPGVAPTPTIYKKGTYIYGGLLQNEHFGHFLIESLSRLWLTDYIKSYESVVFVSRYNSSDVKSFISNIFDKLGIAIHIVVEPSSFETLFVPEQLCQPERGYVLGFEANKLLFSKLKVPSDNSPKSVYVSRSKLTGDEGCFLGEKILEQNLIEEGYAVIHPQDLTIQEQLAIYSNAENIIFSDGSAFHLFVLVANSRQKAFIVYRRKKINSFSRQFETFTGKALLGLPTQFGFFELDEEYPVSRRKTLLDFNELKIQLIAQKFILGIAWANPMSIDIEQEIHMIEKRVGKQFKYSEII